MTVAIGALLVLGLAIIVWYAVGVWALGFQDSGPDWPFTVFRIVQVICMIVGVIAFLVLAGSVVGVHIEVG